MQKLRERNTYTPTAPKGAAPFPTKIRKGAVIPHDRSNCGPALNKEETLSVPGLKTSLNNSDAALTPKGGNMQVYVLNHKGRPIMPCPSRKARLLLKCGKVKVVKRTPFTIQWIVPTRSFTQPVTLKIDSGYENLGVSAVTDKQEVYSAEVKLRNDMVKLNSERKQYRRFRRYHKTWYRQPRFDNRKKPEGWLAPSIQHKLDSHIKVVKNASSFLPVSDVVVEVASFDIQKIKNPAITGIGYQQGQQKDFANVRAYVLHRDGYTCRHCQGKSGDKILEVHHIVSRQIDGDRPENLITLCQKCHSKVTLKKMPLNIKSSNGFKPETFMTTVRWKLINHLREMGYAVVPTYGYITKENRKSLGLPKSHANDAFALDGIIPPIKSGVTYQIKQVRKCNRKLFKGDRSHIPNTAPRLLFGFQRYDKVCYREVECFILGRRTRGYFDLRKLDGTKVHTDAKAKECRLLESAKTLLIARSPVLLSALTDGVTAPGGYDGF